MEDHTEMEEDSTSNVSILSTGGTFITDTTDTTVTEGRHSTTSLRTSENVSEDLLNRLIQEYGSMGWSLPNGPKMLCGVSSGSNVQGTHREILLRVRTKHRQHPNHSSSYTKYWECCRFRLAWGCHDSTLGLENTISGHCWREPGAPGKQRFMTDIFKPSSTWTEK